MQLSIPEIRSNVPHFSVKLRKIESPIVLNDIYDDLVIDYFYELNAIYDGQGEFGEESYFSILLSQKITKCNYEFVAPAGEPNVVTIIFEKTQECTGINLVQGAIENTHGVFLLIGVQDTQKKEDTLITLLLKEKI